MITLWNKNQEKDFFIKSLEFATPQKLFYLTKDKRLCAYWPKNYHGIKSTLQSRNSLIGKYTENWGVELFSQIAKQMGGYAVQSVICEEIGLTNKSPADVAICKTNETIQKTENIMLILEIKMSVVWNWEFIKNRKNSDLVCLGDFKSHQGNPSLLRSDSMLKAIGKSINIRVSSFAASNIPIIIIGNTPVTQSYYEKVDHLKNAGMIQGFWSINPSPLENNGDSIKSTKHGGFWRFDTYDELQEKTVALLEEDREFFSTMQSTKKLGEIIQIASKEKTDEDKAQKFLTLIRKAE